MMYVSTLSVFVLRMLFFRIVEVLMGFNTHLEIFSDKVLNKVVAIVCRWFKTDDDAVGLCVKRNELRDQHLEAISVICKFKRLNEYFTIRRDC